MNFKLDHVGIQTADFENTVQWYKDFYGCEETWSRTAEQLPPAIQRRMPLSTRLVELCKNEVRFHVFDMVTDEVQPARQLVNLEHYCVEVETLEELKELRQRWIDLFNSKKYTFKRDDMPTELIPSSDGMQGFYAHDPNGIELEAFYLPPKSE